MGEVLDLLVQRGRNKAAAIKLMRKLLKKQGFTPEMLVTDKLRSYAAAKSEFDLSARHEQGLRRNNRAENSHQPVRRREFKMQGSSRLAQLSASCLFIPPSTTPSTPSATSHPATRSASSEAKRFNRGEPLLRPEPERRLRTFPLLNQVRVTVSAADELS